MAVQEKVTRKRAGVNPDGSPAVETTWHGQARRPESVAEWAEQRVAGLGLAAQLPAGRVVVKLLLADGDAAVKAALAAGRDLDEPGRYGVRRTLELLLETARQEYPPAGPLAGQLLAAWVRKYGAQQPRPAG